jgi:hypothetical protein
MTGMARNLLALSGSAAGTHGPNHRAAEVVRVAEVGAKNVRSNAAGSVG